MSIDNYHLLIQWCHAALLHACITSVHRGLEFDMVNGFNLLVNYYGSENDKRNVNKC